MNNTRLTRIELFAFNTRPSFLHGTESSGCWYGVLKLTCGEHISYGECILCAGDNAVDLIKWGSFLKTASHCTIEEALELIRLHGREWTPNQRALLKNALESMKQSIQLLPVIVSGAGRYERRDNTYLHRAQPRLLKIMQDKRNLDMDPSLLFDESVSYYSLL